MLFNSVFRNVNVTLLCITNAPTMLYAATVLKSEALISVSTKKLTRKKSKEDKKTLEELNSAHRRSQAKCQLIQTSYIKRIKLFLFSPYNKHLINRAKLVCMGES